LTERLSAAEEEIIRQTTENEMLQAMLNESQASLTNLTASAEKLRAEHQEQLNAVSEQTEHFTRLQAENVALRTQNADLTNYIAGRKSEWDALTVEAALQREITAGLQQAITAKTGTLALQKQENAILLSEIDRQRRESSPVHSALAKAEETLAEERAVRRQLRDKLAEKSEYADALENANAELMEMTSSQRDKTDQLDEKNREINRLQQALAQLEAEHAETVTVLKKQQAVIQHMENEVRSKLEAITVIGRKAQRNISTPASLHQLDVGLSKKSAHRQPKSAQKVNRFMVALNDQKNKEYLIGQGTITIGRGPGNDIRLRHHFISRHHAQILTDANGSVIEDLGSKNGILVNAEPVSRQRLQDGDRVDIGEMQFKFIDPMSHPGNHKAH
jgi:chromosome segregation ATPase